MSGLLGMGGGNSAGNYTNKLSALQVQQAGYGVPLMIVYGTCRAYPTLGFTGNFKAWESKSSAGKGGMMGGGGSTSTEYTADVLFFMGEGEIAGIGKYWVDKQTFPSLNFGFFEPGTPTQPIWSHLTASYPIQQLNYANTVLIGHAEYGLGSTGTLGNHSFEVKGHELGTTGAENEVDAKIGDVIDDFINNPRYGVIGSVNSFSLPVSFWAADYCSARGLLISPVCDKQKPANEYLREWALIANAGIVWSEGYLKFIPLADESFSGEFAVYTPYLGVRFTFTDDNLIEPVSVERKKPEDCFNQIQVECKDRGNSYNKFVTPAIEDIVDIARFGVRKTDNIVIDSACRTYIASIVGLTELSKMQHIRNTYTLKPLCIADVDLLEPTDFISITDAHLGLSELRCRIKTIAHSEDGNVTIEAEEAPQGAYCG